MFNALENLSIDDEDGDDILELQDETLFEIACDIEEDGEDFAQLSGIHSTILELERLHDSVESFGVTQALMDFTNRDRLLSTVFPAFAAIESLGGEAAKDSAETAAALEGVIAKIGEMSASFFEKAWGLVTGLGGKIGSFAVAAYNKIAMAAKWAGGKVFDAAKATGESITAHPLAWIIGSATAAAAAAGTVYALWSGALPTDAESYKKWLSEATSKFTSAFKGGEKEAPPAPEKGSAKPNPYNYAVKGAAEAPPKTATAAALGYTKEGFDNLVESGKNLFKEGGTISKLSTFLKDGVKGIWAAVKSAGPSAFKWAREAISWLIARTRELWTKAPATTMKYFSKALSVFKGLFKSGDAAKLVAA